MCSRNIFIYYLLVCLFFISCGTKEIKSTFIHSQIVPNAYPLITIDPVVNVWATNPILYLDHPQHSAGKVMPFLGLIRVDGKAYRFMGKEELKDQVIAGTSVDTEWFGKYTFTNPGEGWEQPNFLDEEWQYGKAIFESNIPSNGTIWPTPNIWIRRYIEVDPAQLADDLYLKYSYDDKMELYINGIQLVNTNYEWKKDMEIKIPAEIKKTFSTGKIVIAAAGKNLEGASFVDFGIYVNSKKQKGCTAKYTFVAPTDGWENKEFDDGAWDLGKTPFGTSRDYRVNTAWNTSNIWLRKEIELSEDILNKTLFLNYSHDDECQFFINGMELFRTGFTWGEKKTLEIPDEIKETITDNKILVAVHCKNLTGGALIDFNISGEDVAIQKSVEVQAAQTHYVFHCGGVELKLTFTAPASLTDMDTFSFPANLISYEVASLDGEEHQTELYFELSPTWISKEKTHIDMYEKENVLFIKTGKKEQRIFEYTKDKSEREWGYLYLAMDKSNTTAAFDNAWMMRKAFLGSGVLCQKGVKHDNRSHIGLSISLGHIKQNSGHFVVGYDDIYSVQYLGENLRPYWNRSGNKTMEQLLLTITNNSYEKLIKKARGSNHLPLTYRSIHTSYKLVESKSDQLWLFSNKNIADLFSSVALFSHYNTDLLKALMNPVFYYAESDKWFKDYPPSNMGGYPILNGQTGDVDKTIETTYIISSLMNAITTGDGNKNYEEKHKVILNQWNNYLLNNGGDELEVK